MGSLKTIFVIALISLFSGCSEDKNRVEEADSRDVSNQQVAEAKALLSEVKYRLRADGEETVVKRVGSEFQFLGNEDRIVLVDFFSTWCPACRAVAPHLGSIQKKYPEKLLVYGVLLEEGKSDSEIRAFQQKYGATYKISNSQDNFRFSSAIASTLRLPRSFPIPLLVMLKDGKYFTHYIGAVPEEMIESDLKRALRGE
jgi:thiol-disulfide isomerase/thioredoxin